MVVELLRRQADAIGPRTNPFDATLRRPLHGLAGVVGRRWCDGLCRCADARADGPSQTCYSGRSFRNCVGDTPVHRLNARAKLLVLVNPSRKAISVTEPVRCWM